MRGALSGLLEAARRVLGKEILIMAVAFLAIAWFAARRGARWAPWVLLVCGPIVG